MTEELALLIVRMAEVKASLENNPDERPQKIAEYNWLRDRMRITQEGKIMWGAYCKHTNRPDEHGAEEIRYVKQ